MHAGLATPLTLLSTAGELQASGILSGRDQMAMPCECLFMVGTLVTWYVITGHVMSGCVQHV